MAVNHLNDLTKVLRGILLVASKASKARLPMDIAPIAQSASHMVQNHRQEVVEMKQSMPNIPSESPPSLATSFPSPQPKDEIRVIEPEIHSLQGVTIIKESKIQEKEQFPTSTHSHGPGVEAKKFVPRERAVPSNSFSRALGFAGLGASLLFGTARESIGRVWSGSGKAQLQPNDSEKGSKEQGPSSSSTSSTPPVYSSLLSESNAQRLADALCRMRGAALKLGQMLSIQDENIMPPQFQAALERVRAGADVMPRRQLEKVLVSELGSDWLDKVKEFDMQPMAAASIGQVHSATMKDGRQIVMKIQYPGVANSIEADVDNLMRLIAIANILPRGMYVENAVNVAKKELALECDYTYEAAAQSRFKQLISSDPYCSQYFRVPHVISELSSQRVLASEWVPGVHIDKVALLSQEVRDAVGTRLLALTLKELYEWYYMQTDPNWGNFLYDESTGMINLIDFGAAKEYPVEFVSNYLEMVKACAEKDDDEIIERSTLLGFLTGDESKIMMDAHVEAAKIVGTPFQFEGEYDFGSHGTLTRRVTELGAIMLKHRLTPPPDESYSLHRKLSGAFLACIKLRARVPCRELFYNAYHRHHRQLKDKTLLIDNLNAATG